jgi:hypothetical protein
MYAQKIKNSNSEIMPIHFREQRENISHNMVLWHTDPFLGNAQITRTQQ